MKGKRLKSAEEILREQLEREITENEKLKAVILELITRYLDR